MTTKSKRMNTESTLTTTVIGNWADFEVGVFEFRTLPGYLASSADYVCPTDGTEVNRSAHEQAVLELARTVWAAPDDRAHDAISFEWR